MKVELDLSSEQLELLDKGLKDCLLSLNDEQKLEIIRNYINTQLENIKVEKQSQSYWGRTEYEYTDFGKQLIEGLQDKIKEAITTEILAGEQLQSIMSDIIKNTQKNLYSTIQSSIVQYTLNNLFHSKETLHNMIMSDIYNTRRQ